MANNKRHKHDIHKCSDGNDGYLIVKTKKDEDKDFLGCSNYGDKDNPCAYTETIY